MYGENTLNYIAKQHPCMLMTSQANFLRLPRLKETYAYNTSLGIPSINDYYPGRMCGSVWYDGGPYTADTYIYTLSGTTNNQVIMWENATETSNFVSVPNWPTCGKWAVCVMP